MISYAPLYATLRKKNVKISSLRGTVLSSTTVTKINSGEVVKLDTIEKICLYLDVSISEVVEIIK